LPAAWASKSAPPKGGGPSPSDFSWELTDTPGLDDSKDESVDQSHLEAIAQAVQTSPGPVNVIALVMPILPPRFDTALQKTLKIIDAFFTDPQTWLRVCIVATNVHPGVRQAQRDGFTVSKPAAPPQPATRCVRDEIIGLLQRLHDWRAPDPEFPVFFVDSNAPHGPTESEFIRFIQFASVCALLPGNPLAVKVPDLRVMRSMVEEKTEKAIQSSPLIALREADPSRPVRTKKVKRKKIVRKIFQVPIVTSRSWDVWDIFTLTIARWFQNNVVTGTRTVSKDVEEEVEVDEPIPETEVTMEPIEYIHYIETKIGYRRTITWDFTAELPINYHDNFDTPKAGRTAGPWTQVSYGVRQWDEGCYPYSDVIPPPALSSNTNPLQSRPRKNKSKEF
jgi:hypothetical protein